MRCSSLHTVQTTKTTCDEKIGLVSSRSTSAPVAFSPRVRIHPQESDNIASRKLALLKRSGLFGSDLKGAIIERASTARDLRDAYRLVHSVYLNTGYIGPEPAGMRLRIFEMSSETATFIAKVDGHVVGVLSIIGDSVDLGLPSDSAFKMELDAMRATGVRLCEVTNQVVADDYRRSAVSTELMRCAIALTIQAGYHEAVAAVSPSHRGFYEMLRFRKLGAARSYSQKLHDPVIAMGMNVDQYREEAPVGLSASEEFVHRYMTSTNPFLECTSKWSSHAKGSFLNYALLDQLFVKERNFLSECSASQLSILKKRWGTELFHLVCGMEDLHLAEVFVPEEPLSYTHTPFSNIAHQSSTNSAGPSFPVRIRAFVTSVKLRVSRLAFRKREVALRERAGLDHDKSAVEDLALRIV